MKQKFEIVLNTTDKDVIKLAPWNISSIRYIFKRGINPKITKIVSIKEIK